MPFHAKRISNSSRITASLMARHRTVSRMLRIAVLIFMFMFNACRRSRT
jgi:hypothetical protein